MRRLTLALAFLVLALAPTAHAGTPVAGFRDSLVATGLDQPTAIAFLPDGRLLVTEKTGALKLVQGGAVTTLVNIPVCSGSEMGLLGVAIDPNFAANGFVYLYRTKPPTPPGTCASSTGRFNQVVRVTMVGNTVNIASLTELLTGIRTDNGNHDGGTLRIGPFDQKLYVSVGDTGLGDTGAPGDSTNPYSQALNALEGKLLRLELTGAPAAGNPFIGQPGARPEIWAYGFRNPFRFGIDPVGGAVWVGDVGQSTREELDNVVPGGNYAWPHCEGTLPAGCQNPGDDDPFFEYPHSGTSSLGRSITGGAFAGTSFGPFGGQYFFGDYVGSKIYRAVPNGPHDDIVGSPTDFVTAAGSPVDIIFGPGGALYYVAIGAGQVRTVAPNYDRPAAASPLDVSLVPAFRQTISATQCGARGGASSTHGAPLSFNSCNPPAYSPGTAARLGAQAQGSAQYTVVPGDLGTPADEADVSVAANLTDVRSIVGGGDYTPSPVGPDATLVVKLRLSDILNGAGLSDSATVVDFDFSAAANCAATPDPAVGATCSAGTTADAVTPAMIKEGKEMVLQVFRARVEDSGANGTRGDADDRMFATQGLFIP